MECPAAAGGNCATQALVGKRPPPGPASKGTFLSAVTGKFPYCQRARYWGRGAGAGGGAAGMPGSGSTGSPSWIFIMASYQVRAGTLPP